MTLYICQLERRTCTFFPPTFFLWIVIVRIGWESFTLNEQNRISSRNRKCSRVRPGRRGKLDAKSLSLVSRNSESKFGGNKSGKTRRYPTVEPTSTVVPFEYLSPWIKSRTGRTFIESLEIYGGSNLFVANAVGAMFVFVGGAKWYRSVGIDSIRWTIHVPSSFSTCLLLTVIRCNIENDYRYRSRKAC